MPGTNKQQTNVERNILDSSFANEHSLSTLIDVIAKPINIQEFNDQSEKILENLDMSSNVEEVKVFLQFF